MSLWDRLGERWLHLRYGTCTQAGLRSCVQPVRGWIDEAQRFERALRAPVSDEHRAALETVVAEGRGVIRQPWSSPDANIIGDIQENFVREREASWPPPDRCPDHGVAMIYHPASGDRACTVRGCRYYHGMKAAGERPAP